MNFQTKVYVGSLPENCSLEAFRSLFEKHGKIVECDIVKNYGFVHFAEGEDAKLAVDALNDTKWDGITLKVELSHSKVRHKPGMGNKSVCYRCGKSGHWSKDCPKGPSRGPTWNKNFQTKVYVGNLPENCSLEAFRSLFEKHGKVVECDIVKNYGFVHFADGEDAELAVDMLNDTKWNGVTLKVKLSDSKVRSKPGMGSKSVCYVCGIPGHWSKDCPRGPSQGPSWNNSNNYENRGQLSRGNRDPYMNGGSSSSSGGFLQSGPLNGPNGYQNDSFRNSYGEPLFPSSSSSSSHYERNNSNAYSSNSSSQYHNSSNGGRRSYNNIGQSRDLDRDNSRNDPYYDSYPPPPPPPTRYRPYPNAYERRAPLPPLPGTSKPLIPSLLSSSSSSSHYNHKNNNNHYHSSSPTSHNNNSSSSSIHDLDPYDRPPPEYYEQQRGSLLRMPGQRDDWRE